jgi:hypothetical protein
MNERAWFVSGITTAQDNGRTRKKKHVPVSVYPPLILHGLAWNRTQVPFIRGRRMTARAMHRPT